jgi:hypothetical protein
MANYYYEAGARMVKFVMLVDCMKCPPRYFLAADGIKRPYKGAMPPWGWLRQLACDQAVSGSRMTAVHFRL